MLLIAFVLAVDCAAVQDFVLPAPAAAAQRACGEENLCNVELAQKFANGDGVERDFAVAEYFLCRAADDVAEAELEGMTEHLQRMRRGETEEELDFCDHATSGYASSYCASVLFDEVMPRLDARMDAVRKSVTAREAFDALRERGLAFVRAESERIGIQSRGGTGYAAITLGAEMDAKESFVKSVELWSSQRALPASAAQVKRADNALNETYRAVVRRYDESEEEEVREWKTFLRDAQRAWIAYRDAFAAYYVERWRGAAPAEELRREIVAQLTADRTGELRDEE